MIRDDKVNNDFIDNDFRIFLASGESAARHTYKSVEITRLKR